VTVVRRPLQQMVCSGRLTLRSPKRNGYVASHSLPPQQTNIRTLVPVWKSNSC